MKRKNQKELDVDFLGGMGPLNDEDRRAISAFIQARKKKQSKKKSRITTTKKKSKTS